MIILVIFLVVGVFSDCIVHEKAEGVFTYHNISDLGKAVLDKADQDEIDHIVETGCNVNYNGTSLDFSDYDYYDDYDGYDYGMNYYGYDYENYWDEYGYDEYDDYDGYGYWYDYDGYDYHGNYSHDEYEHGGFDGYNYIYDLDYDDYDYYYDYYDFDYDVLRGLTALHISVLEEDKSMVSKLVTVPGIDLEMETSWGGTALLEAASWGYTGIMKELLAGGADANHADPYTGLTPLHLTSFYGPVQAVEVLDHHGADLDKQTRHGETALHLATIYGYPRIVEYLLARGVDRTVKDKILGYTALDWAREFEDTELVNILQPPSP